MRVVALLVVLIASPGIAEAQVRESQVFDECALRVEQRLTGTRIVRGTQGEHVASRGLFGPSLAPIVASSDSAVTFALRSDSQRRTAQAFSGIALLAAAAFYRGFANAATNWEDDSDTLVYGGAGVAVTAGLLSGWQHARSMNSLEQSIWWYNRGCREGAAQDLR